VEQVFDKQFRVLIEVIVEKAKLLINSSHGETILESIATSLVDLRVGLESAPNTVATANDLYLRLTHIVEGRRRIENVQQSFDSTRHSAEGQINSIASRTYTYGGTIGLPLLLAGMEADACVKRDEKQIRSIEQQVSGQRNQAERQVGHYQDLINSCLILCNHYMLLLWSALGKVAAPDDLPDFQIDQIFDAYHLGGGFIVE
jgi:hypothetical protein